MPSGGSRWHILHSKKNSSDFITLLSCAYSFQGQVHFQHGGAGPMLRRALFFSSSSSVE